jgi:hypothetical protein
MPSVLLYLLLPIPVALMAAGLALEGHRGLPRLRRRPRTRTAVPGGTRRDFFGDCIGADIAPPQAAPRPQVRPEPLLEELVVPEPAPVMGPRAVPDPPAEHAHRAA